MTLKDVQYALDGNVGEWSLMESLNKGVWPPLKGVNNGAVSLREVFRRFSRAGDELRKMANEPGNVWKHMSKPNIVNQLRHRIRDAAVMKQNPTDLCGPMSVMMEFARRNPGRFVRGATELMRDGVFTTQSGRTFVAAEDLRDRPVPNGDIEGCEWIYAATMRDSENVSDDIDNAEGIEGITWPFEIEEWIEDVLGLKSDYFPCVLGGELGAIKEGQRAVEAGGVAILLIDVNMVKHEDANTEENLWYRNKVHRDGGAVDNWGLQKHCKDDDYPPDHYIVLLGELSGANSGGEKFRVLIWSFGKEYEILGHADSFGEYLYGVMTGRP